MGRAGRPARPRAGHGRGPATRCGSTRPGPRTGPPRRSGPQARTNPAAAADAAWAASDTLHVAADALGSDDLRQAADAFDRAARAQYGRIPAPSPAGNQLRQAARLIAASAHLARDPALTWLVLIASLAALAEAVAELRAAQQRAAQAAAARTAARHLRAAGRPAPAARPGGPRRQHGGPARRPVLPRPGRPGPPRGPHRGGPPPGRAARAPRAGPHHPGRAAPVHGDLVTDLGQAGRPFSGARAILPPSWRSHQNVGGQVHACRIGVLASGRGRARHGA